MSRLTKLDNDITKVKGTYMPYDERPIVTLSNATYVQCLLNKLGKLEDLEEEIGVNNLIAFLEWCVKFRNNFINRSFDDMVAFYKRAMCETEKRSE